MNGYSLGRSHGRLMLAAGIACLVVGCSQVPDAPTPAPVAPVAVAPPAESPAATTPAPDARMLPRAHLGKKYCLVRELKDAGGNTIQTTKMPIVGLLRPEDWATEKDIPLTKIPEHGNCPANHVDFSNQVLRITAGSSGAFRAAIIRDPSGLAPRPMLNATFSRPAPAQNDPNYSPHQDAYLAADKHCQGTACGDHDRYDAYLYVVDTAAAQDDVPKLVIIDLFEPSDPNAYCKAERLEMAVHPRESVPDCVVPAWVPGVFSAADGTAATLAASTAPVVVDTKQTGTGGGYEPPR